MTFEPAVLTGGMLVFHRHMTDRSLVIALCLVTQDESTSRGGRFVHYDPALVSDHSVDIDITRVSNNPVAPSFMSPILDWLGSQVTNPWRILGRMHHIGHMTLRFEFACLGEAVLFALTWKEVEGG